MAYLECGLIGALRVIIATRFASNVDTCSGMHTGLVCCWPDTGGLLEDDRSSNGML